MPEKSGEEGSSTIDKLVWAGLLGLRGTGVARELGGGLVLANLPSLSLGCWPFFAHAKLGCAQGMVTTGVCHTL